MKKILLMLALASGVASAHAQSADTTAVNDLTLKADIYPQQEDGDLYHGLSRKLTFDRMIPPYGLEVTYDKTTHIIFPSAVRYVDLGSPNLIAGKADGSENVIRVKATRKNFREETNMSVITESGSFYTFNVKYADEPLVLNIEMADFIHDGSEVNRPNNALDIYLKELGSESPKLVHLIAKAIHQVIFPLRAYNYATAVAGKKDERTVFVFDKFTIPADKMLVVEMHEKSGGRHQTFTVESEDIVRARVINELKVK